MSEFNKEKLQVTFMEGTTEDGPIIPRIYTLTHSDLTAELFLSVGSKINYDKITPMRDEVVGEWKAKPGEYVLKIDIEVDGAMGIINTAIRDGIFRNELPLALKAIVYGDRKLFMGNKELLESPVEVHFNSSFTKFNTVEYWGSVRDYLQVDMRNSKIECFRVFTFDVD